MTITEVLPDQTPNQGRLVWNSNDKELEKRWSDLFLNVRAEPYQAAGDGTTDDRPAIQSAIDNCSKAGGGSVFLPAGNYLLGSGGLIMRDLVNLIGAGMYISTLRLGNGVSTPVITDNSAGQAGGFAFGRIYLSNLGIDGNRSSNPGGQEGIFTTAYYSLFENLYIHECQTHGIRMGFDTLGNNASQNRVAGCRVSDCNATGIYLDQNAVDHTITENYIHDCDTGILIKNGGIRVINNDIYNHNSVGIMVAQTAYDVIIQANDFNGNKKVGISVTRTSVRSSRLWGQILVSNNSIFGDGLDTDNLSDGIVVDSPVENGIDNITLTGNKIFSLNGQNRFRYGINLAENITGALCAQNHIDNTGSAKYNVAPTCSGIEIDSLGAGAVDAPNLPPNGTPLKNPYHTPVTVYVAGGDITAIEIDGTPTGQISGSFHLSAGQTITINYNFSPSWSWFTN